MNLSLVSCQMRVECEEALAAVDVARNLSVLLMNKLNVLTQPDFFEERFRAEMTGEGGCLQVHRLLVIVEGALEPKDTAATFVVTLEANSRVVQEMR